MGALFCIGIFSLFSCYSSPENVNQLADYSDIALSELTEYNIEIGIFNKNIVTLKKNVSDEVFQNDGKITHEEIQSINAYRMAVSMPKNNTANFITKIKTFGLIVSENVRRTYFGKYFNDMEMGTINRKNMLEKYNKLLEEATTISDKLMLETAINRVEMEIKGEERQKDEMESRLKNNTIIILLHNKY
jgi:cell division protein ZapA (FtsZ GTPase activity inhibitor)